MPITTGTSPSPRLWMTHLCAAALVLGLSACGGSDDAAPAPAPEIVLGTAAECFNPVWRTPGTRFYFDYAISGSATGKMISSGTVNGDASYNGYSGLIEVVEDQITTYTAPDALAGISPVPTVLSKSYFKLDGMVEYEYGGTAWTTTKHSEKLSTFSQTTVVYTLPTQDKRFTLAPNGLTTYDTSAAITTQQLGFPQASTTANLALSITYLGQETITIPAGTFVACKFQESDQDGNHFVWIGKGNGAPLRMTGKAANGTSVMLELTATSVVNGKPL